MNKEKNPKGAGRKPKLTQIEKMAVYAEYKNGVRVEELAVKYSIGSSTVRRIISEIEN